MGGLYLDKALFLIHNKLKEERKKKDKKQQKADNVYLKGQTSGFDIKV